MAMRTQKFSNSAAPLPLSLWERAGVRVRLAKKISPDWNLTHPDTQGQVNLSCSNLLESPGFPEAACLTPKP